MDKKFQKKMFNREYKKFIYKMGTELLLALKDSFEKNPLVFGKPITVNETSDDELSLSYDGVELCSYIIADEYIRDNDRNNYYSIWRQFINFETRHCDILGITRRKVSHEGVNALFINNIVSDIKSQIVRPYVHDAIKKCVLNGVGVGWVHTDGNDFSVDVTSRIDLSRMDVRYFTIDSHCPQGLGTDGTYTTTVKMPIADLITVDEIADMIQNAVAKNQRVFDSCYAKYDDFNERVGGCIIHIGKNRYLSHRSLQPTINSSFLTFKCPYLNDIITMNITAYKEVRIERMDEFHMLGPQPVLLS